MTYKFKDFAVDAAGNIQPSVSVTVRTSAGVLATITTAAGGALTNPFTSEADGSFEFAAARGRYYYTLGVSDTEYPFVLGDPDLASDLADLGDQTKTSIAARDGWTGNLRYTLNTLAKYNDDVFGHVGAGPTDLIPRAITASQSGTTVTATDTVFDKRYIGTRILWDSGEEAVITAVAGNVAAATATVDRSQTVASGAATIRAKHYIALLYGDSMGQRFETVFCKLFWRKLGFGGIVVSANTNNKNAYSQAAKETLSSGASTEVTNDEYDLFPWSQYWQVPNGETAEWQLQHPLGHNDLRRLKHGLAAEEMTYDTFVLVWRRAAGAFTVERKRAAQATWETVDTVSDASAGSGTFGHRKYTHAPYHDWVYRISVTSGTVKIPLVVIRNDQTTGYLNWSLGRGTDIIDNFDLIPYSDLGELCRIVGQPDTRYTTVFDAGPDATFANSYTRMETDRTLWAEANPRMDHVHVQIYEGTQNQDELVLWNAAAVALALDYDDGLIALYDFFGDLDTVSTQLGWINDGLHINDIGSTVAAWRWLRQMGLEDIPTLREGRDVSAQRGDFWKLRVLGRDVGDAMMTIQAREVSRDRGLVLADTDGTSVVCEDAMGAALGTGDFTTSLHLATARDTTPYLSISSDGRNRGSVAGKILIRQEATTLNVVLTDASGTNLTYRWNKFTSTVPPGTRGILTLRADASRGEFDWFWNGEPLDGIEFSTTVGSGDPFGTWAGTGQDVAMFGAALADAPTYYHVMAWRRALSDAEIRAVSQEDGPAGTAPDIWLDFRGHAGRAVRDLSGNGAHGLVRIQNDAARYNVSADNLVWAYPDTSRLGHSWVADANTVSVLMPGDDIIVTQSLNRAWSLPATASVGDVIRMTINTSATITVAQAASQQIKSGASATTAGTGGSLTIPDATSVTLRCITGGASTVWVVESHTGAAMTFT